MYLYIVIHCVFVLFAKKCNGDYERSCRVLTKHQHIEAGSDAEFVCRSTCVSEKVFWTVNRERVNENLSRQINSTHSVLRLPFSLLQNASHPKTVECHSVDHHQVLGGTTIRIYSKPHNLSCTFHSHREMKEGLPRWFTCRWEHQITSPLKVQYSVICANCASSQLEICVSNGTNCDVKTQDSSISFVKENTIYVRARTDAWEVNSSDYTFKASQIFQIPPRRVNVTANLDDILVEWNSLPSMGVNGRCQVKYEYTKDEKIIKEVLNKTLTLNEKGNLTIDKVESCRKYALFVRCALDQAPWSYWSQERTILTKLKKSDVHLDVWRKVSKLHGQINVHIKWKGIPSNCPGTLSYSVSHAPHNGIPSGANCTWTLCSNSSCDIILNQEAYSVNLTVFFNGNFLAVDSLYLPASAENESDSLFLVKNIETKHELNDLLVRWSAPIQPVSGYVIDWTHNGNEFDWKRTRFPNTTLQGLIDKKPYNITVTPLLGNETGQSTQISGVCSSFANPGKVTIDNLEAYDRSAHVSWSIKPQDICSDAVVKYTVFYKTMNGPELNVTVNTPTRDIYLKNLNPNTHYSVHVEATARVGNSVSTEGQFKTRRFDPRLISICSVTGSILILFCLVLGCVIRKFYEIPVPDPSLSSLALWPQTSHQKAKIPFEPFNTPSESLCELVYTEDMDQTSIKNNCKSSSPQNYERPFLSERPPHSCGARDGMSLLNSENNQFNPYRSQTTEDSPAPRPSKNKRVTLRPQEKTPSYVSLDIFDS